ASLYTAVTDYVQEEFNRADNLDKERKNTVGFALTILQRRLASSPEAIYQSLKRRRERLESRFAEERLGRRAWEAMVGAAANAKSGAGESDASRPAGVAAGDRNLAAQKLPPIYDDYDDDDMPSAELEDTEEKVVDQASAAQTISDIPKQAIFKPSRQVTVLK
ncbi:MAG: hypothetical protein LBR77_03570, partial [Lachnospiraceae bacterium]|nr:hypothetical protein [Lachnospiraceae bacterium]